MKIKIDTPRLSTAYWIGQKDARGGAVFAPEMYFVRKDQQLAYAQGYETVKATESSRQFLRGAK